MIDQLELMRVVEKYRGNAVVMPVFRASLAWPQVSRNPRRDIPIGTYRWGGAMGTGSSFALGVALARPDTKVIIFDGDGSLQMNLGSLVTVANKGPKNLYHFVIDNGVYATTGGQDTPAAGQSSLAAMAAAAGYAHSYEFDDLEDFATQAEQVLSQQGPVLISVKVVPDIRLPDGRSAPPRSSEPHLPHTPEVVATLKEELASAG